MMESVRNVSSAITHAYHANIMGHLFVRAVIQLFANFNMECVFAKIEVMMMEYQVVNVLNI